jgi:hypothetical protein
MEKALSLRWHSRGGTPRREGNADRAAIMGIFVYPPEKVYSREISKDYLRPYSDA